MTIKRIGAGNRMSKAVIHEGKVYLSGLVAERAVGKSVKEQTQDILGQIADLLKRPLLFVYSTGPAPVRTQRSENPLLL